MKICKSVLSRVPVRIDWSGGYSDIPPFCDDFTGHIVNAAISIYTYIEASFRDDKKIKITSLDYDIVEKMNFYEEKDFKGSLGLIKRILYSCNLPNAIELRIKSEAPPGSGLGTSASVTVGILTAIYHLCGKQKKRYQIAEEAAELQRLHGIKGGKQDEYAVCFGGFNRFEFHHKNVKKEPLILPESRLHCLERHLLIAHPGGSRNSGNLVDDIVLKYRNGDNKIKKNIQELNQLALKIKNNLLDGTIQELAVIVDIIRKHQKGLDDRIVPIETEQILPCLDSYGVKAKPLGGGGCGACLLIIHPSSQRKKVKEFLEQRGYHIIPFCFDMCGYQVHECEKSI